MQGRIKNQVPEASREAQGIFRLVYEITSLAHFDDILNLGGINGQRAIICT